MLRARQLVVEVHANREGDVGLVSTPSLIPWQFGDNNCWRGTKNGGTESVPRPLAECRIRWYGSSVKTRTERIR